MAAKRPLRHGLLGVRSAMWSFHLSDEQRNTPPAKALPFGFRRIGPGYFVARLANALRPFDAARAAYPNQCVRNAAHGEY
jgi:hypothetical protein